MSLYPLRVFLAPRFLVCFCFLECFPFLESFRLDLRCILRVCFDPPLRLKTLLHQEAGTGGAATAAEGTVGAATGAEGIAGTGGEATGAG